MDYQLLKESVKAVIKQNGNQEITGDLLQATLMTMINSLGSGYQFAGVADGAVIPGTPDSKFFYIAAAPGTYENFGGLVVNNGELAIFFMPEGMGSWYKQSAQISTSGLFFGGVIGTAASPTTDTKMFYVATEPGTYQNFNNLVVNFGEIGVFTKPTGSNVWTKQSIKINPYGFTLYSNTVYASNSLPAKPTDGGKYMILVDNVSDGIKHRYIYTSDPAVNSGNWASMLELQTIALGNDEASAAGNTPSVPSSTKLSDELADISTEMGTKADKVVGATDGNVAELDGNGNLKDGGVPVANLAQKDGYYQSLTAGAAENLIGRGTVNAEFTRRTSGGTADIGTGAANIKKIKGNTIVWNQLIENPNTPVSTNFSTSNTYTIVATKSLSLVANHKYFIRAQFNSDAVANWVSNSIGLRLAGVGTYASGNTTTIKKGVYGLVVTCLYTDTHNIDFIVNKSAVDSNAEAVSVTNFVVVDLTLKYGSGNEPSYTEELALFPYAYYAYNAGILLSLTATGLVTTGFNQWDEEWESGGIGAATGQNYASSSIIRSKNYIPVFGGTAYYATAPSALSFRYYDAEKNYLGVYDKNNTGNGTGLRTMPDNCRYLRFEISQTTYNNDICINISWSGVRNGEYEPYEKHTLPLNLTSLTSGGTAIFPDGMKSAGSIFDEVDATKAFKRVGVVDLGSLDWSYINGLLRATISDMKISPDIDTIPSMICPGLETVAPKNVSNHNMTISSNNGVVIGQLIAYADAYVDNPSGFKTAMSGVYLYYELETPVEYVLDSTLNLSYYVNDFGTEEITPENGPVPSTAPIIYEVLYAMNAVDTLRNLPKNYISKSSMEHILTALVTAGIIAAYTLTWNATTETYDCTITPIS